MLLPGPQGDVSLHSPWEHVNKSRWKRWTRWLYCMDGRVPWPVRELLLGPVLSNLSLLPLFARYNSATKGYANPSSLYSFLWRGELSAPGDYSRFLKTFSWFNWTRPPTWKVQRTGQHLIPTDHGETLVITTEPSSQFNWYSYFNVSGARVGP